MLRFILNQNSPKRIQLIMRDNVKLNHTHTHNRLYVYLYSKLRSLNFLQNLIVLTNLERKREIKAPHELFPKIIHETFAHLASNTFGN